MRSIRLALAAVAATGIAVVAAPAPAQAAVLPPVFTVYDQSRSEYTLDCTDSPPSSCDIQTSNSIYIGVSVANRPKSHNQNIPITVNYEIIAGTATAGADYTGTTGQVVIGQYNQNASIVVPLINDGVAEASETFTVRITSTSVGGNISDTGTGTITDGDQFPDDCTLTQDLGAQSRSLTCTARPANQQWFIIQPYTTMAGLDQEDGNIVTGNGTSTATYPIYPHAPFMYILS